MSLRNIGSPFVVPTVAACVDLVVHVVLGPDGTRRVEEILAVRGRVAAEVIECWPAFPAGIRPRLAAADAGGAGGAGDERRCHPQDHPASRVTTDDGTMPQAQESASSPASIA